MKKLLLLFTTIAIISCNNDRTNEKETVSTTKTSIQGKTATIKSIGATMIEVDPSYLCKSGTIDNFIEIDPNLPYNIPDVPVNYLDGSCDNTVDCIDLAHFVDRYAVYGSRFTQVFFGTNQKNDFLAYENNDTMTSDYKISELSYSGNMFTSPMSNDAINTISQAVQTQIIQKTMQGLQIVAVYYSTENYLCIPARQNFNFSIKYKF